MVNWTIEGVIVEKTVGEQLRIEEPFGRFFVIGKGDFNHRDSHARFPITAMIPAEFPAIGFRMCYYHNKKENVMELEKLLL